MRMSSFLLSSAMLLTWQLTAEPVFIGSTDHPDGVYKTGEPIKLSLSLVENDRPVIGRKVRYRLEGGDEGRKSGTFTTGTEPFQIETRLSTPGWVRCLVTLLDENGNPCRRQVNGVSRPLTGGVGAVAAPETFDAALPEPADFDAFWQECRNELAAVPLRAERVPIEVTGTLRDKVELFDIKVDCAGGKPVSGYLAVPKTAPGTAPAVVFFHSAGVRNSVRRHQLAAELNAIVLDYNAHGIENGQSQSYYNELKNGALRDYVFFGSESPQTSYFRGMFMRVMRALEYVKSLPEWDGRNLICFGGSQGGAQILAGAGLDSDVNLILFRVPAMCNNSALRGQPRYRPGWPFFGQTAHPKILNTALYFDGVYFARRINPKCEAHITVGLADTTSPPPGVYAAFNRIRSKDKHIYPDPDGEHVSTENRMLMERLKSFIRETRSGTPSGTGAR